MIDRLVMHVLLLKPVMIVMMIIIIIIAIRSKYFCCRIATSRAPVMAGARREVYERLTAADVRCNLVTGQEVHEVEDATHVSSTVEMVRGAVVPLG